MRDDDKNLSDFQKAKRSRDKFGYAADIASVPLLLGLGGGELALFTAPEKPIYNTDSAHVRQL
ncbi:MAG: hypothetical protein AABY33_10280 [Pseudomonadota bacterium]